MHLKCAYAIGVYEVNIQQKIACPICGKQNTWNPINKFRPFCSTRCKLIDLGEWASETRRIPSDSVDLELISDAEAEKV
jgi:endogenous inhibitor of DNA gyrase (YacG/DUF329 family)